MHEGSWQVKRLFRAPYKLSALADLAPVLDSASTFQNYTSCISSNTDDHTHTHTSAAALGVELISLCWTGAATSVWQPAPCQHRRGAEQWAAWGPAWGGDHPPPCLIRQPLGPLCPECLPASSGQPLHLCPLHPKPETLNPTACLPFGTPFCSFFGAVFYFKKHNHNERRTLHSKLF